MAKVSFNKLGLKVNQEINTFTWEDQNIEVKKYLPISDKFDLISKVLNNCQDTDNNNFMSISKMVMYFTIHVLLYYTNINVTDKMKDDPAKLYDLITSSGLMSAIKHEIPEQELVTLFNWCQETCEHLYKYRNSVYAILDAMTNDYDNLKLNIDELQKEIKDPDTLNMVKDILTKID